VVVAGCTGVAVWRSRRRLSELPDWTLMGIVATGLFASVLIVHLSDQNFWLSSGLTLPIVAMLLKNMLARMSSSRFVARAALLPVAAIYLAGLSPLILGYALTCHTDGTGFLREVGTPRGSICTTYDSAPIVAGALTFTSQHPEAIAFMPNGPSLYLITGRVPPVPVIFLLPGVTPPAELTRAERAMQSLPVEWVIYYNVDFSKDLPAVQQLHNGSPAPFDLFLAAAYQQDDQDGLTVFRLRH
jgi:hypothetical protein